MEFIISATADQRQTSVQGVGNFKEDLYEDEAGQLSGEDPFDFHLSSVPHRVSDGDVVIHQTEEDIEE